MTILDCDRLECVHNLPLHRDHLHRVSVHILSVAVLRLDTQPNHTFGCSVPFSASHEYMQIKLTQQTCCAFFPPLSQHNVSVVRQNKGIMNESELRPLMLASVEEGGLGIFFHYLQLI